MERKNTILLTTIAIITLLVAVVGATFAYYTVETKNSTSPITFTGNGNPVGAITLTSPNTSLSMTITPTDMAKFNETKHYYALTTGTASEAPSTSSGIYGITKKEYIMNQADLVGGNNETAYTCTADLIVTLTTGDGTMGSVLAANDAILYFTTINATMDQEKEQSLDLSTIKSGSKTYKVVYKVNGLNSENRKAYIKADLELNNATDRDQKYLAGPSLGDGQGTKGSTLTVTLQSTDFSCSIDTSKATS